MKFDLIVVPGSHPDLETWLFPEHIYKSLDQAAILLKKQQAPYIAVCGKWVISFDHSGIHQPFKECDAMADYLISKGVPKNKILKENESKDTISNLYFLRKHILLKTDMKNILFLLADFRIPRLEYLRKRILGKQYEVHFKAVETNLNKKTDEQRILNLQKEFLTLMKDGDYSWLDGKFYTAPIYKRQ